MHKLTEFYRENFTPKQGKEKLNLRFHYLFYPKKHENIAFLTSDKSTAYFSFCIFSSTIPVFTLASNTSTLFRLTMQNILNTTILFGINIKDLVPTVARTLKDEPLLGASNLMRRCNHFTHRMFAPRKGGQLRNNLNAYNIAKKKVLLNPTVKAKAILLDSALLAQRAINLGTFTFLEQACKANDFTKKLRNIY